VNTKEDSATGVPQPHPTILVRDMLNQPIDTILIAEGNCYVKYQDIGLLLLSTFDMQHTPGLINFFIENNIIGNLMSKT